MRYRAFFSYARADDRIANWLHRQLDGYRTPKALVGADGELGPVPPKLHPIFRDRTDLESGGHVDSALQQALEDSETLIVLCTPTSAKSHWVNHEVETFLKLGREAAIFPVIAAGVPDSGDPETECFPPALRGKGLLAADLREIKLTTGQLVGDGREGGRLKLIAGLLGVKLDALVQRERRRQRQVVAALGAAALVFAGVAAIAGVQTLAANKNEKEALAQKSEALAQKKEALFQKGVAEERTKDALFQKGVADENARQREIQRLLAQGNEKKARTTLHRFFATQAWARHDAGDFITAARYALSGMRRAPENIELYRAALAGAMHMAGESAAPLTHDKKLLAAAFSPDGSSAATLLWNGDLSVWDTRSGALLSNLDVPSDSESVGFTADGTRVWTSTTQGDIRLLPVRGEDRGTYMFLLDESAGPQMAATSRFSGPMRSTEHVALSRDGTRAVHWTASKISVWNTSATEADESGDVRIPHDQVLQTFEEHKNLVVSAAITRDGARVVSADADDKTMVWSTSDGRIITPLLTTEGAAKVAFSQDETRIVTAGTNGQSAIWNAFDGTRIATLAGSAAHTGVVWDAAFSHDGAIVATAGEDRTAKVWDARTGSLIATLSAHEGALRSVAFSRDDAQLLTAGDDGIARIWDLRSLKRTVALNGYDQRRGGYQQEEVAYAAFSSDRSRIVTLRGSSYEDPAQLWDTHDGRLVGALSHCCRPPVPQFSGDGARVVTVQSNKVSVWDARNGSVVANLDGINRSVSLGDVSFNGAQVALGQRGSATIWNVGGQRRDAPRATAGAWIDRVVFSVDGARMATVELLVGQNRPQMLNIWRARDGRLIARAQLPSGSGEAFAFSPDGAWVITNSQFEAQLWDASTGVRVATLDMGIAQGLSTAAFSSDSRLVVATSYNGSPEYPNAARIFDARSGNIIATMKGDYGDAAFSKDGTRVLTVGADGAQVWDARDGRLIARLTDPNETIAAAFTSRENGIVMVTNDARVTTWHARRLTQSWAELEHDACLMLGPKARRFPQTQIDLDQLLIAEWRADRDVCEGVPGVPSIAELRRRAGLPAVAER